MTNASTPEQYARRHAFSLPLLPPKVDDALFWTEIKEAHRQLGILCGALIRPVVNPKLLITPLLTKEAVSSSSIEGTVATVEDVFRYEAADKNLKDEELRRDAQEIINYRRAVEASIDELGRRAIGENLLKSAHSILLNSVRGSQKSPGEFRRGFVYVGNRNAGIGKADFIPPPPEAVPQLIRNWEGYINSRTEKDSLVQIAVAHYQLEAIHPFNDGNGRIGRLVIPLFLADRQLLPSPVLYISEFFEQNRDSYLSTMRLVDCDSNWTPWIHFFLDGVRIQAIRTTEAIRKITELYETLKTQVGGWRNIHYGLPMLDQIFIQPVLNYSILSKVIPASPQTIYNLLEKFTEAGILSAVSRVRKHTIFIFPQLLELLR